MEIVFSVAAALEESLKEKSAVHVDILLNVLREFLQFKSMSAVKIKARIILLSTAFDEKLC